jgi:Zn-dependent peptidase ImmA (M78 family)
VKAKAAKAALFLLRKSHGPDLPISVTRVAASLDIGLAAAATAPLDALLIRGHRRGGIIVTNAAHPKTRRRFSAAHELGHYYLGHYANGDSWTVRYEWAANVFAAELLMPMPAVISFWFARELRREPFLWRVAHLAARFAVSREAAAVKVKALRLEGTTV